MRTRLHYDGRARRRRRIRSWVVGTAMLLLVGALPAASVASSHVGTTETPIRLSASAASGGAAELGVLAAALGDATGLEFEVGIADYGGDGVGWMCGAYPDRGVRIMAPEEFIVASDTCGADTRLSLFRFGSASWGTEFLVPKDSSLAGLDDLDGLDWHYPTVDSISGYAVPLGMLNLTGVTGYTTVEVGSHDDAVQAVYDNAVSGAPEPIFATTFVDARTLGGLPADVSDKVRVLAESSPIPHPPIAFGPGFPAQLRSDIESALVSMANPASPDHSAFEDSLGLLYSATGLTDVTVADFAFLGTALDAAGVIDWEGGSFADDDGNVFESDIEWMAAEGITKGCNPPENTMYCPSDFVTRDQMAAFLVRALDLPDAGSAGFVDTVGSTFEKDIDKLAAVGITKGCNPPANDRFCPWNSVTRGQMAAFLVRALGYTDDGGGNLFIDADTSIFENDIDKLGTAGVTKGCNPPVNDRYCPTDPVTRGQMAAFLHRALG